MSQAGLGEMDQRLAALLTNVTAVRAVAAAVEGTIGPKGLNTMLVDDHGHVIITNDGVTILENMEAGHPAARLVIGTARSQEEQVGDGTTTATILASALVTEGYNQAVKGVPTAKLVEGITVGVDRAKAAIQRMAIPLCNLDDPRLIQAVTVAGRGDRKLAELVMAAACLIGRDELLLPHHRFAQAVIAMPGAQDEVIAGLILDREPLSDLLMPINLADVRVMIVDDALAPDAVEAGALATDAGFAKLVERQEEFRSALERIIAAGARCVLVDRGVDDLAEEMLTEAGILVLHHVAWRDWRRIAEHCGARPVKRAALRRPEVELAVCLGHAQEVRYDEGLRHFRILGGTGRPAATILVGAATSEVMAERERVARDAAAALQAGLRSGLVPGGGAAELAALADVEAARKELSLMAGYGVDCVIEALRRPMAQIVHNAGFNALEKVSEVMARQTASGNGRLGIDCETGAVVDMVECGVLDPAATKIHAMQAAAEIAAAILRIDTIIRRRQEGTNEGE